VRDKKKGERRDGEDRVSYSTNKHKHLITAFGLLTYSRTHGGPMARRPHRSVWLVASSKTYSGR
jgi:hypothetical protein